MMTATPPDQTASATIRADEAAHFGKMAAEWWDPKGSSAMLHRLNPVRLGFIRDAIDAYLTGRRRRGQGADAFGLWGNRKVDGLAYQEKLRGEW